MAAVRVSDAKLRTRQPACAETLLMRETSAFSFMCAGCVDAPIAMSVVQPLLCNAREPVHVDFFFKKSSFMSFEVSFVLFDFWFLIEFVFVCLNCNAINFIGCSLHRLGNRANL